MHAETGSWENSNAGHRNYTGPTVKTIDDLIDILSTSNGSIEDALIKAQVLAHRLGDAELAGWVKAELTGYPDDMDVPLYRARRGVVMGTISDGYREARDVTLPLSGLTNEQHALLLERPIREGIGEIDYLAQREEAGKQMAHPIDPIWFGLLSKGLSEDYGVQQAWIHPPLGSWRQIVTQVRTRLLDFALKLQDKVPSDTSPSELKSLFQLPELHHLFRDAVGSPITFVFNTGAIGEVSSDILVQNNFPALKLLLAQQGIDSEQIGQLEQAINEDHGASEHTKKKLGHSVAEWLGDLTKSTVKAGAETAIKAALNHFYGF